MSLDIGVYGARGIPSTYSGYETFLTVLLPALARRGHDVTLYCRRGQFNDPAPYRGVRRVLLPALRSFRLGTLSHAVPASLVARFRRHQVVFVVNIANVPACLLGRATGQRTVLNTDGQEWIRGKWGRGARAYWRLCARLAARTTSALVADSTGMHDVYRQEFSAESTVIPYCWTDLEPDEDPSPVMERFSLEPYRYFVVAARLNPENNVAEIARGYVRSGVRDPLLVLGEANYDSPVRAELARLAGEFPTLRIHGHVDDRHTFATLVAYSSAYIHGHRVGGINPSLLEAMGSGANVIALDTVFNREALGPAGTYFSDFEQQLADLIASAQSEGAPAGIRQREAARCRVREVFSLEAVVDAYEELFVAVARRCPWSTTSLSTRWYGE